MRLYLIIIFFGCGNSSIAQQSEARVNTARKWVKRTILKSFNFLPYIEYKPSIVPSETGEVLLKDLNIFAQIHYPPISKMKGFKNYYSNSLIAEDIGSRIISIPMFPQMKDEEIDFVIEQLNNFSNN